MEGGRTNHKPSKVQRRERVVTSEMTLDECKAALDVWFTHQQNRQLDDLLTLPLREWDWKSQPGPQQMCDSRLQSLVQAFLPKCRNLTPRLLIVRDALFQNHMEKTMFIRSIALAFCSSDGIVHSHGAFQVQRIEAARHETCGYDC